VCIVLKDINKSIQITGLKGLTKACTHAHPHTHTHAGELLGSPTTYWPLYGRLPRVTRTSNDHLNCS